MGQRLVQTVTAIAGVGRLATAEIRIRITVVADQTNAAETR